MKRDYYKERLAREARQIEQGLQWKVGEPITRPEQVQELGVLFFDQGHAFTSSWTCHTVPPAIADPYRQTKEQE